MAWRKAFYEGWNLFSLGAVHRQDELVVARNRGLIGDSQYNYGTMLNAGSRLGSLATGWGAGSAVLRLGVQGIRGGVLIGAASGLAADATIQAGDMGIYSLTNGKAGQEEFSVGQMAMATTLGGGIGAIAGSSYGNMTVTEVASRAASRIRYGLYEEQWLDFLAPTVESYLYKTGLTHYIVPPKFTKGYNVSSSIEEIVEAANNGIILGETSGGPGTWGLSDKYPKNFQHATYQKAATGAPAGVEYGVSTARTVSEWKWFDGYAPETGNLIDAKRYVNWPKEELPFSIKSVTDDLVQSNAIAQDLGRTFEVRVPTNETAKIIKRIIRNNGLENTVVTIKPLP